MSHQIIETTEAPKAIGPYSQAVRAGDTTFFSGQIALCPDTGELVGEGDVSAQTLQVMKNLKAVIVASDHVITDLVKVTIFLRDLGHFSVVNELYADALEGHKPARATVEVSRLPKDVLVEIDAVAIKSR